jgi:hypothetical protein
VPQVPNNTIKITFTTVGLETRHHGQRSRAEQPRSFLAASEALHSKDQTEQYSSPSYGLQHGMRGCSALQKVISKKKLGYLLIRNQRINVTA